MPQAFDRAEAGGAPRGVEAEEDADRGGEAEREEDRVERDDHRPVVRERHAAGGPDAQRDAEHPARPGQGNRLHEKLQKDVAPPRADGGEPEKHRDPD